MVLNALLSSSAALLNENECTWRPNCLSPIAEWSESSLAEILRCSIKHSHKIYETKIPSTTITSTGCPVVYYANQHKVTIYNVIIYTQLKLNPGRRQWGSDTVGTKMEPTQMCSHHISLIFYRPMGPSCSDSKFDINQARTFPENILLHSLYYLNFRSKWTHHTQKEH